MISLRGLDLVLVGLILFMLGALIAHLGRPEDTNTATKWLSIAGAILIVVFGLSRLLGVAV